MDKAVVNAKIKYVNAGPIFKATFADYFVKRLGMAFSSTEMTSEENQQFLASIMNEQINLLGETYDEKTINVDLEKIDGTWLVSDFNEDLVDVIFSGLVSALQDFGE